MKRFYNYFLSLFLLTLVGIVGASAQIVREGARITTEDAVAGKEILLRTMGTFGSNGYLSGTGYSASVTKECVYIIEATGKTVDGHKTYTLKRKSTDLYLADPVADGRFVIDNEDSSESPFDGHMTVYTSDKSAAMEFTCLPAVNEGSDKRSMATTANGQDLSQTCFVLCRAEFVTTSKGDVQPVYFGHYYEPFYSFYQDTNAWQIYVADSPVGKDLLYAVNSSYFTNGDPLTALDHGTAPGQYKESLVQQAHSLYEELQNALNDYKLTNEQAAELGNRVIAIMDQLNGENGTNGFSKGFYYIYNLAGRSLYTKTVGGTEFVYASDANYARPTTDVTVSDVDYIWEVTSGLAADGTITIKNAATGNALSGVKAFVTGPDDKYGFTLTANGVVKVGDGNPSTEDNPNNYKTFTFSSIEEEPGGNGHAMYHAKYDNKAVMGWNAAGAKNNCFRFAPVSAETIQNVLAEAKQAALNSKLSSLYSSIVVAMNNGYTETSINGTNKDESFIEDERALVVDASQWYTANKDPEEGTIEALSDGVANDPAADFFHTDWHAGAFTPSLFKNHFLVASIPEGVTGGLDVKFAKRINKSNGQMLDYPTVFAIYGSNDFDSANPEAATWKLQGISNVNFKDSIAVTTPAGDVKKPAIGIASTVLDGTYHAIKLAVLGTDQGRGYWAVSELNLWQADVTRTATPEFADVQKNAPQTIDAVNAELAKAEVEVNAGKATKAQIDALTKAYAEFQANYPNPQRVTDAYTAAKTFLDNAKANGLVGPQLAQYPTEASTALNTILAKYENFEEVSLSAINAAVAEINNGLATFKASIKLPEAGKYYTIRSASRKVSDGGSQYGAIVYSRNNSIARNADTGQGNANDGGLWMVRMNLSDTITSEASDISGLSDTLTAADDLRQVWKAETSANGKIVLRNMATGMYLKGENGYMSQSTTPFEVAVEGIKPNTFRFNAGDRAGKTWYMNAKRLWSKVVTWTDAADQNSNWTISEVRANEIGNAGYLMENAIKNRFYIVTMPFEVSCDADFTAYNVLGVTADGKLALTERESDDPVPAATPFILQVNSIRANVGNPANTTQGLLTIYPEETEVANIEYAFDVQDAAGLKGTLTEEQVIGSSRSYLLNNKVVATTGEGTYTVPVNSGYFGYVPTTAEDGDATIEIADKAASKNLTGISENNVVVLPSVVNVYSIDGTLVRKNVKSANAAKNLPAGLYIIGGQKVIVK